MNHEMKRAILYSCGAIGVPFYSLVSHPERNENRPVESLTVHCVKWGMKYGARYVNNLFNMVTRNLPKDLAVDFVCHTEDSEGVDKSIQCRLFDPASESWTHWWLKGNVFNCEGFGCGDKRNHWNLYLDLDTIILGNLDFLLSLPSISRFSFFTLNAEQLKCEGKCSF